MGGLSAAGRGARDAGGIADPIDLDAALDELFVTPPEEFVAARNALAKALRAEKRRDEAAEVGALRRPTRTVAALNRLALSDEPAAPALWDAVGTVQTAGDADFRAAVVGLRDAMAAAIEATLAGIVDERPEDRGDLTTALQAIVGDDEAVAALRRGRLEEVPAAGLGGFGAVPLGAAAAPRREPASRRKPKLPAARGVRAEAKPTPAAPPAPVASDDDEPDAEVDDTLARRRAEKQASAAAAAAEKAERALAAAEAEAEAAGEALSAAEARVAEARVALEEAETEQEAAEAAAATAEERLEAARAAAREAADAHDAAVADLAALD